MMERDAQANATTHRMSVATGPKTNFHNILSAMIRNSISATGSTFSRLRRSATSYSS
jgi:hypothetical protein